MATISPLPELWLTLAQAFLPPLAQKDQLAFRNWLADDLSDLCCCAGLEAGCTIDAFKVAAAEYDGADELLGHYSSLFLAPPVTARLNVATCLQGTANGPAMDAIEALLGKYGMARNESFRDTPDHLASLLEFMAVLEAMAGTEADQRLLASGFLAQAVRHLRRDVAQVDAGSPYLHLLDILSLALAPKLVGQDETVPVERRAYNRDPSKGVWRECSRCGQPIAREKELAIMAQALAEHGLGSEHLNLCPDCRNPIREISAMSAKQ